MLAPVDSLVGPRAGDFVYQRGSVIAWLLVVCRCSMNIPKLAEATDTGQARQAALSERHTFLERELEAAPFHKVGTFWWDERVKEMKLIKRSLDK